VRLFFGIELAPQLNHDVSKLIAALGQGATALRLRVAWVPAANLHVTTKFLGPTPEARLEEVMNVGRQVASASAPFEFQVRDLGAFPTLRKPSILYAEIHDPAGSLHSLASALEEALGACGFPRESREYAPHLTLGRVKEGRGVEQLLEPYQGRELGRSSVTELLLYESTTLSTGAVYRPVERFGLRPRIQSP
jgi:RNA 2',3'-cyclic 3'-phosphodiesterase